MPSGRGAVTRIWCSRTATTSFIDALPSNHRAAGWERPGALPKMRRRGTFGAELQGFGKESRGQLAQISFSQGL
jgi:hypothetical protein